MALQQQALVYWFKQALGALDKAITSTANIATSGNISTTGSGTLTSAGAATLSSTLGVTGATTLTGGLVNTPPLKIWNHVPAGALATRGTDAARTAGTLYYSEVHVPGNVTLTGVGLLLGTTAGTDSVIVALYDTSGNLVANSALAGTATSGGDVYQQVAFTSTYAAVGPARYFIGVQINGTTDGLQFHTTLGPLWVTGSEAGSFGTLPDPISSLATTHTDNVGPMAYLY